MSQEGKPDFYTQKGYQMRSQHALTGAMEDYLEMICRQAEADGCARIGLLAEGLNVRPSSASKMVYQLRALGLVAFEKYGLIQPTEKGWSVGRWLLHRHEVLHRFFCMLNGSTDELELVEQVEHYLNEDTVRNLEALLERLEREYHKKRIYLSVVEANRPAAALYESFGFRFTGERDTHGERVMCLRTR